MLGGGGQALLLVSAAGVLCESRCSGSKRLTGLQAVACMHHGAKVAHTCPLLNYAVLSVVVVVAVVVAGRHAWRAPRKLLQRQLTPHIACMHASNGMHAPSSVLCNIFTLCNMFSSTQWRCCWLAGLHALQEPSQQQRMPPTPANNKFYA
eukprot:1153984-Pelagomonas_calceolata.AAC.4